MQTRRIPIEAWKWLEQDWIYAGRKSVPECTRILESNDHMVLWRIIKGQVTIVHEDLRMKISSGQSVLLMPGMFTRRFSEDNRIISLRLRWQWPTGEPLFPDAPPLLLKPDEEPSLDAALHGLIKWTENPEHQAKGIPTSWKTFRVLPYQCTPRAWCQLQEILASLQTRLLELLEANGRAANLFHITDGRILEALTRIQRHPLPEPFSVEALATAIGLSRSRFTALFHRQTGFPPATVFRRRKRQHIAQLLQFTNQPIKQIAYESGFASLSLFSDWCRRSFASPPTRLRRRALEGDSIL